MAYFNPEKFPERIEKDEFLMSPKVDFCFKELMQNAKVGSTV